MPSPLRVAVWSGPRCRSTALLRAWESRADTAVSDEPLYGVYLASTGLDHPGRDEILAALPTDWRDVAAALTGPVPDGADVWVQKHMAHHLLPHVGREWLDAPDWRHAFLIRDPAALVVSLDKVWPGPATQHVLEAQRDGGTMPPEVQAQLPPGSELRHGALDEAAVARLVLRPGGGGDAGETAGGEL